MRPDAMHSLLSLDQGNPPAEGAGLFGASLAPADANLVLLPVPWDLTTSYGQGTKDGPAAILKASHQLDLFDLAFGKPFLKGVCLTEEAAWIRDLNDERRPAVDRVIHDVMNGTPASAEALTAINAASQRVNQWVYDESRRYLQEGKLVAVLGGDHSSPLGLMHALAEQHPEGFGVLHVDAHHDLRQAYEGMTYSHASIMYNALEEIPAIQHLVTVAIRDFSTFEHNYAAARPQRVSTYYANHIFQRLAAGEPYAQMVMEMLARLPEKVYVSFDIDGLDPAVCPSTGTPVPGGLSYHQGIYLLEALALTGKKVIGFDLCEVTPSPDGSEWDANVGSRILYKLCGATLYSRYGRVEAP